MRATSKGQYFSFDAVIASLIFLLTMISLLSYWYNVRSTMDYQQGEITKQALRVSDIVLTPAYGQAAPNSKCQVGFTEAWGKKVVNYTALDNCKLVDEDGLRNLFGTPYNVTVRVGFVSAAPSLDNITIGLAPDTLEGVTELSKVQRLAAVSKGDGTAPTELAIIEVYLYR
jgi:hypothetical protein